MIFFVGRQLDIVLSRGIDDQPVTAQLNGIAEIQLFIEIGAGKLLQFLGGRFHQHDLRGSLFVSALFPDKLQNFALLATGLSIIEAIRREYFAEDRPLNPPAKHIAIADSKYHLGTADPLKIELIKIGYDKESFV